MGQYLTLDIIRQLLGRRVLLSEGGGFFEARFTEISPSEGAVRMDTPGAVGPYRIRWHDIGMLSSVQFIESLPDTVPVITIP